jgi:hypothetical protein
MKTSPKRSFSVIQNERFGLGFVKTRSKISGTVIFVVFSLFYPFPPLFSSFPLLFSFFIPGSLLVVSLVFHHYLSALYLMRSFFFPFLFMFSPCLLYVLSLSTHCVLYFSSHVLFWSTLRSLLVYCLFSPCLLSVLSLSIICSLLVLSSSHLFSPFPCVFRMVSPCISLFPLPAI